VRLEQKVVGNHYRLGDGVELETRNNPAASGKGNENKKKEGTDACLKTPQPRGAVTRKDGESGISLG